MVIGIYSCHYTHHHEAVNGAKAIATAVYMAKRQCDKNEIRKCIEKNYHYQLKTLEEIRDSYVFDSRASYSVPPAIEAFLESDSYEDAVRKAISIGGDSDTIACMAGGIAHAYYRKIPDDIRDRGLAILDIGLQNVALKFEERYF